ELDAEGPDWLTPTERRLVEAAINRRLRAEADRDAAQARAEAAESRVEATMQICTTFKVKLDAAGRALAGTLGDLNDVLHLLAMSPTDVAQVAERLALIRDRGNDLARARGWLP